MKLTADNYFSQEAQMEYMSASQFKAFDKCEAAALAEIKGEYIREKTTALMVGSYVVLIFLMKWSSSGQKIQTYSSGTGR